VCVCIVLRVRTQKHARACQQHPTNHSHTTPPPKTHTHTHTLHRLQELHEKEQQLLTKRNAQLNFVKELRSGRKAAVQQLTHGEGGVGWFGVDHVGVWMCVGVKRWRGRVHVLEVLGCACTRPALPLSLTPGYGT
jgi:hypothetical protein